MYFDEFITKLLQRVIHITLLLLFLLFLYHFAFPLLVGLVILSVVCFFLYMVFFSAMRGKRTTQVIVPQHSPRKPSHSESLPPPVPVKRILPQTNWRDLCQRWLPILAESVCGAGIGLLIVFIRNQHVPDEPWPMLFGILIGAPVGFAVSFRTKIFDEKLQHGEDTEPVN